jgi:hypothetical protein
MFKLVDGNEGVGIAVKLPKPVASFLKGLPELLDSVGQDPHDPAAVRLNPAAYADDPLSQSDFSEFAAPQLEDMRRSDREDFAATLANYKKGQVISLEEAEAWLTVIGDARLALAARAGINDPGWEAEPSGTIGPIVATLGYVQSSLVKALSGVL